MNRRSDAVSLLALGNEVVLLAALYYLGSFIEDGAGIDPGLPGWLLLGAGCYGISRWFLRKPRAILAVVALEAALCVLPLFALLPVFLPGYGAGYWAFGAVFWMVIALRSYLFCLSPPKFHAVIGYFERSVLMLALLLWMISAGGLPQAAVAPVFLLVCVNLFGLIALRSSGGERAAGAGGGGAFLCAALALIALVIGGFTIYWSDAFGAGVEALLRAALSAALWCFAQIGRFLSWLAVLLPYSEAPLEPVPMPEAAMQRGEEAVEAGGNPLIAAVFLGTLVLVLVGGILYLLYRNRKTRIGGLGGISLSRDGARRKGPGLLRAIRRAVRRVFSRIYGGLRRFFLRDTAEGTLFYLERWGLLHGVRRRRSETARAFLSRAGAKAGEEAAALLIPLADELDQLYYARGRKPTMTREQFLRIRNAFR